MLEDRATLQGQNQHQAPSFLKQLPGEGKPGSGHTTLEGKTWAVLVFGCQGMAMAKGFS